MRTTYITFRGEEDVVILYYGYGYEADINAHNIDWHFLDEARNLLALTDQEEKQIYQHLLTLGYGHDGDDGIS